MPTKPRRATNYWWVTASKYDPDPKRRWHWQCFFKDPGDRRQRVDWGRPGWINSRISYARIAEMRKGDIVVAYQAGEGIRGLAYLARGGYQSPETGEYDTFNLKSSPTVWFDEPIPYRIIREIPNAKEDFEFVKIKQGTVFRISNNGFNKLSEIILALNPTQKKAIARFLK